MQRDTMVRTLKHLGLNASNYRVLKLLPLVYVASSTGAISPERERRVIELAHSHFHIGPDGERILQGWLDRRPDKAYFEEGLRDIVRLAYAPDEWEFDVDELRGLLAHAAAIARTSAAAMDQPTAPSSEDERALAEVARELGIVNGESWGELVRELGAMRATPEGRT